MADEVVELPQYRCHKIVRAAKITDIDVFTLHFGEIGGKVGVSQGWALRHNPAVGGYYVVYDDGYTSYSPAQAFEEGYARI